MFNQKKIKDLHSHKLKNRYIFINNVICKLNTQKGILKELQPIQKGPFQINDKPTNVTYELIDSNKRNSSTLKISLKPTLKISKYRAEQQIFLTLFNFQYSQITQNEFEQIADLLLKYPKVYATSKFDI